MKFSFSPISFRSVSFAGFILAAVVGMSSCSSDKKNEETDPINASQTGSLELEFDNRAGNNNLILNTGVYTNGAGNQTSFTTFNYYISNIKLMNENGTTVNVPGYYLVKESDATSQLISIPNVQEGNYNKIQFMVGVDSAMSNDGAAAAAAHASLDPARGAAGHYWSWNNGYIFAKVEGTSPDAPLNAAGTARTFVFHVGGYKAVANGSGGFNLFNNTRVVTLDFPNGTKAMVRDTRTECHIHTYVDALRFLSPSAGVSNGVNVNFTTLNFNMAVNANAQKLANNYAGMFAIDHVHND